MKWFEHDVDMHTDLKIQTLIEKYGLEGYAIWCLCLEFVGKEGKKGRLDGQTRWQEGVFKVTGWSNNGEGKVKLKSILGYLAELKLIDSKSLKYGHLNIPKFTKRMDSYTKRKLRTISEQTTDNVPLQYNTRHNITLHYLKLKGWEEKNLISTDYALINKGINLLWRRCPDEAIIKKGLDWVAGKNWKDWTILALDKWWLDFIKPEKPEGAWGRKI